jgi:antitoxin VapB
MAFHIRDRKTDELVRRLAESRRIGITEAVREATEEALKNDERKLSLWARTADIRAEIAAWPKTGLKADKAFFDSLTDGED